MAQSDPRVGPEVTTYGAGASLPGRDQWWATDALLVDDGLGFYGISTGFADGKDAGRIACEALDAVSGYIDAWRADVGNFGSTETPPMVMNEAFEYANDELRQLRLTEPDCRAVGVTMSAIWFFGGLAVVGHVGDARVHRLRGLELRRLTHDHVERPRGRASTGGALTRCVGVRTTARPEVWRERVHPGDRYLLGSPTLYAAKGDETTLVSALRRGADPAVEVLSALPSRTSLTFVAVECSGSEVGLRREPIRGEPIWASWASA